MVISARAKIVERAELPESLAELRRYASRLVCTNGVFDLLHLGHLRYLEAARCLGDALIVGINSDASARRLKGPTRPLVSESERAELIAGLACVDLVTIFDEDTAEALLQLVRPLIYVKGGDYARPTATPGTDAAPGHGKALPEAAMMLTQGGRVELIPYLPGHSTTELIARITTLS